MATINLSPINDLIKNYPWAVLVSGAVTLIAGTFAVASFAFKLLLDKQKTVVDAYKGEIEGRKVLAMTEATALKSEQDRAISELRRELEKESDKYQRRAQLIDRGIASQDFLDVSKYQPIDMVDDELEKTHFKDDRFWAHNDPAVWEYKETSLLEVYQHWFGEKFEAIPILKQQMDASMEALKFPVHLWRGTKENVEVQEHAFLDRMYPFIIVQRLPRAAHVDSDAPTKVLFEFLMWVDLFERSDEKTSFKVTHMQNASGTLYLRGYFSFRDIKIDVGYVAKHEFEKADFLVFVHKITFDRTVRLAPPLTKEIIKVAVKTVSIPECMKVVKWLVKLL